MHSLLHDIPRFFILFLEELFLIFNQMLSIRAFGRREYAAIIWQAAKIQQSLFCKTNFVRWVFMTRGEYIANNYWEQCSSQNIHSIFIRYSHKDSFSVRIENWNFTFSRFALDIFKKRITKALISLRGCAGWSVPVLFANCQRKVFSCWWPNKRVPWMTSLRASTVAAADDKYWPFSFLGHISLFARKPV